MLRNLFTTKAGRILLGLLAQGWSPERIGTHDMARLKALFARHGCQLKVTVAARILARAHESLPPHPAATVGKPALLAALLATLETLDRQVTELEATMAGLLPHTEGAKLTQINGISTVVASGFVAFVGSARRWGDWSKVWRGAGLDPARCQSGPTDVNFSISREGSAWGGGPCLISRRPRAASPAGGVTPTSDASTSTANRRWWRSPPPATRLAAPASR